METPLKALKNKHLENVQQNSTPLKIPPSPLLKNLGYGTGVEVFCINRSPRFGKFRSPWVIKKISKHFNSSNENIYQERLKQEAEILKKLVHPNIVGFRGYNESKDGKSSLVLEFCHISLGQIIEERNENDEGPLESEKILKMSIDILKALDYLHNEAKVLHADIKSFNILVKNDFEICKLCDFGVSLLLDENGFVFENQPYVGTELWSAPEIIDGKDKICYKADIFSFGLVIYETIALIPPHTLNLIETEENDPSISVENESKQSNPNISIQNESTDLIYNNTFESNDSIENSKLEESNENALGTRPPLPNVLSLDESYNKIIEIFYLCTNEFPEDRPNARDLHKVLAACLD